MELRCPQCGKVMTISQEELVIHDSQVVCPQCLAVCCCVDGQLVVRDEADVSSRRTVKAKSYNTGVARFCHSCGSQLPSGIRFCPYCGVDLKAPFSAMQQAVKPQSPEPAEPVKPMKSVKESTPAVKEKEAVSHTAPKRKVNNQVEDKLRTVTHHYKSSGVHLHQHGTMPGKTFKIIAYSVIFLLLILLVVIIIAGNSIETSL